MRNQGVHRSHTAWLALGLLAAVPALGLAQGTSDNDAVVLALKRTSDAREAVQAVARPEASAAATAAEAVAKAANAAIDAADALKAAAAIETTDLASLKKLAAAADKAATAAAAAADGAAGKAAAVAGTITADPAKSVASGAAAAAVVAARNATESATKVTTAVAQLSAATVPEAVRKQAAALAEGTYRVAGWAAAAASETAAAALEGATPSLPSTTDRDESVLAALRARITGGAIFFNGPATIVKSTDGTAADFQSDQFGRAATYLAVEAQPRLWSAELGFCGRGSRNEEAQRCRDARARLVRERGYHRLYVDPFVNLRLTTIAVAGTNGPSAPATISAPTPAILQSQKAAQIQLGAVTGVNFGRFRVKDSDFHWGGGPVFRFMVQNVTDSQRALRVWDIDNDLFKIWTAGVRLTLYEKDRHVGELPLRGWAPAAYLDVSSGRFENFETARGLTPNAAACLSDPRSCLASGVPPEHEFEETGRRRYYVEGRVFLQFIYLGFDLNTGPGPDDLRFIGGVTVKLDQFITRR